MMTIKILKALIENEDDDTVIEIPYKAIYGQDEFDFTHQFMLYKSQCLEDGSEIPNDEEIDEEDIHTYIELQPISENDFIDRQESGMLLYTEV